MDFDKRIDTLDYLRGFALMGIILVNIIPMLSMPLPVPHTINASYWRFLYLFVEGRFYTIFTFLFGVGFYLFITRAEAKGRNGYVLFLRRMIALFIIGYVHVQYLPGEALTIYAVCGILIMPFYKANKMVNLIFGIAMLIVLGIFSFKLFMVLPLMLLGIAAGQFHVFEQLAKSRNQIAIFTSIMLVLSIIGVIYQYQYAPVVFGDGADANFQKTKRFLNIGITIGPLVSAFYAGLLIWLLQLTLIQKLLSPLKSYGRMALTNYVSQTAFVLLAGKVLHLFNTITYIQSLFLCLAILGVQLIFSQVWLQFFRFGPLEWIWRIVTYFEIPPLRK
ncbi:DUF418 domain-containing protein [Neobacillus vireti]|uniref:DUF418 domain-containing protein n=1 Tax=Neobacillus vireti LMG 21834 TaxID=1131730 RepID=A0AB94IUG9_9BACI|nr:DUF418 domain-containing protein [Neobacillus vireti]ETI70739.1 hypothetical protein BAVI_00970 [Neobacillus vireti LMG 21834]KLT18797.1 membrane protein [Neobacillus vireti]